MNEKVVITIATDFSDAPGARYRTDGPKSGQEFLEELLRPKFLEALDKGCKLLVDMDDVWGYASSFISGSFGKLSHEFGAESILEVLEIKSDDEPLLEDKIVDAITKPDCE